MYNIINFSTNEHIVVNDKQLQKFIEDIFPDGGPNFWDWLYNKRLKNSSYPYSNNGYQIKAVKPKTRSKSLDFSKKFNLEENEAPLIGRKRNYNEWTIYNEKTQVTNTFTNLSAVARYLNIKYSWLYPRVRYNTSFSIGHIIFTFNTTPEKEYYKNKLNEVM